MKSDRKGLSKVIKIHGKTYIRLGRTNDEKVMRKKYQKAGDPGGRRSRIISCARLCFFNHFPFTQTHRSSLRIGQLKNLLQLLSTNFLDGWVWVWMNNMSFLFSWVHYLFLLVSRSIITYFYTSSRCSVYYCTHTSSSIGK